MELRHLRYFVAVAERLSFSRAAVHLHLAQPSLSTQIRDLEDELGFRLLDRDHNRVALTDAGAVFLRESRQVLASAKTAGSPIPGATVLTHFTSSPSERSAATRWPGRFSSARKRISADGRGLSRPSGRRARP